MKIAQGGAQRNNTFFTGNSHILNAFFFEVRKHSGEVVGVIKGGFVNSVCHAAKTVFDEVFNL